MSALTTLKAPLKRGALVTAANWPLLLVQFVAESTFKLLVAVPVIGGVFLVALALGRDVDELWRWNLRDSIGALLEALRSHPAALSGFVAAVLITVVGGSALMFLIKGGTLSVLIAAEADAGPVERLPVRMAILRRLHRSEVPLFLEGCHRLFPQFLRLGICLLIAYALFGGAYLSALAVGYRLLVDQGWATAWPFVMAVCSVALFASITFVNLTYLLLQMVIAATDSGVGHAFREMLMFVGARFWHVSGVFVVTLVLVLLATMASLLATTGLSLISFVPFAGLAVLPLQVVTWLLRGLVFQYLGLAAFTAYLSIYQAWRRGQLADETASRALSIGRTA
ncbi:MAG: hypothetical protein GEU99_17865 [Luteitalea sp.]|nr:hypothetical protein [Luteitalea sp.]